MEGRCLIYQIASVTFVAFVPLVISYGIIQKSL
jgi:hypothetical protein